MIFFPTNNKLPNYKEDPLFYNKYSLFKGKDVYSSYVYWILKNHGVQNIKLVTRVPLTTGNDAIFFHFDNAHLFDINCSAKKIQFISDKPLITGCDLYLTSNKSVCSNLGNSVGVIVEKQYPVTMSYFPEPLPVGLKKNIIQYPPRKAACIGLRENIDNGLKRLVDQKIEFFKEYAKSRNILKTNKTFNIVKNITYEIYDNVNNNKGDEDLFFFIRNKETGYNYAGYKHPNRLFISFYCNIPGFYNEESAIRASSISEYDYVKVENAYDFIDKLMLYVSDKGYFFNILKQTKSREKENNEEFLVKCFGEVTQQLRIY